MPESNEITIAIQAPVYPPAPHPHDRALLRPLASLGKPKTAESGVSFLRRTEYISSHTGSRPRFDGSNPRPLKESANNRVKKLPTDVDKDSPEYIKAKVERSFQIAQMKLQNPSQIRHPTRKHAKLVSAQPLLPDLTAFSDVGGYLTIKFATNPVPPSSKYDPRLDASIFRPVDPSPEAIAAQETAQQLHEQDPSRYPAPPPEQNYEFFMLDKGSDAKNYKRKADNLDPDHESDDLYTYVNDDGQRVFRFARVREYEMANTIDQFETKYDDELALASHDGRDPKRQKAMYYYPIIQRQIIRPQRKKNMDQKRYGYAEQEETGIDIIDVKIRAPNAAEEKTRREFAENPLLIVGEDDEVIDANVDAEIDGTAADVKEEPKTEERASSEVEQDDASGSGE